MITETHVLLIALIVVSVLAIFTIALMIFERRR